MNFVINVANKIATVVDAPVIICGNSDYVIDFTFDSEWDDYEEKTARFKFKKDGKQGYIDVLFSGTQCNVPILSNIDVVEIGVYAGNLSTTTGAKVDCERSILCGGNTPYNQNNFGSLVSLRDVNQTFANALKGSASGNPIIITDSSPLEHEMKVQAAGKNLFDNDTSKIKAVNYILDGVENTRYGYEIPLTAGTYTIHAEVKEGQNPAGYYIYGSVADRSGVRVGNAITIVYDTTLKAFNFTIKSGEIFKLYNASATAIDTIPYTASLFEKYNIQIEVGTTATAYTPFIANEDISVTKYGKNLLSFENFEYSTSNTIISFKDGLFRLEQKNTVTSDTLISEGRVKEHYNGVKIFPAGTYFYTAGLVTITAQQGGTTTPMVSYSFVDGSGTGEIVANKPVTVGKPFSITAIKMPEKSRPAGSVYESYFQLECGSVGTDWELFKSGKTYTAYENGNVGGIMANGEAMTLIADNEATITAEYNIDTKKYIDKKFAEMQALILEV